MNYLSPEYLFPNQLATSLSILGKGPLFVRNELSEALIRRLPVRMFFVHSVSRSNPPNAFCLKFPIWFV